MSVKIIVECDICKKEIRTSDSRLEFSDYHAHVGCLNSRIVENLAKTFELDKVQDVRDFLFFDGFKEIQD